MSQRRRGSVTGLLEGKVAVITAAASGMGRAGAELFAREGAHVIGVDLDGPGVEKVGAGIAAAGGSVEVYAHDLGDQEQLGAFLAAVKAKHDVVDVLYNHVGITGPRELDF